MSVFDQPTAYGTERVNSEWSAADIAFFAMLRNAGLPLNYDVKQAFYTWRQQIGGGGGSSIIMRCYMVGTPDEEPDANTVDGVVAVGGPTTIAAILAGISGGKALAVFVGNQFSEPDEFQQTNFINDINVYVLVRLS